MASLGVAATRKVRVNTVAFDVEAVLLLAHGQATAVVNGIVLKKSDVNKYLLPHQRVSLMSGCRLCYISVFPYGVSFDITDGYTVDPNLTSNLDNDPLVSPNDERTNEVIHYKHHTRTLPYSETCFTVPVGGNFLGLGAGLTFFSQPSHSTYAWSWFPQTWGGVATEELVVIPLPDVTTAYPIHYLDTVRLLVKLAYVMPDCAMRDAIYSNYQVIRGNEYGSRESIIDYPVEK